MSVLLTILLTVIGSEPTEDYIRARVQIAIALREHTRETVTIKAIEKKRIKVDVWSAKWCKPCKLVKADIEAGLWAEYEITIRDYDADRPPENMTWLPAITWQSQGKTVVFPHNGTTEKEAIYERKKWQLMIDKSQ